MAESGRSRWWRRKVYSKQKAMNEVDARRDRPTPASEVEVGARTHERENEREREGGREGEKLPVPSGEKLPVLLTIKK